MSLARWRLRRYMALMAAVPALALAMAGPAQAAPASPPACPASTLCTYQNSNYDVGGGNFWYYSYSAHSNGAWFYVGNAANDQISSYYNRRGWWSYMAINCPADRTYIGFTGGTKNPDMAQAPLNGFYNDSISAIGFATSASQQSGHFPAHGQC